jgi:hypothetical protein
MRISPSVHTLLVPMSHERHFVLDSATIMIASIWIPQLAPGGPT